MPRRIALALALAFTVVVTFAIIGVGARAGMFGDSNDTETAKAAAADLASPAQTAAPATQQAAPAVPEPRVVTEYVYVDDPAQAQAPAAPPAAPPATLQQSPTEQAAQQRSASPTQAATTQAPAPTATAASTAVQPSPTARPAVMPAELEFVGTVTSIDGQQVTFSYGGNTVVVQVNDPAQLSVGDSAHVHAKLSGGVYVATEIEMGN